jgi:hypothetical protein
MEKERLFKMCDKDSFSNAIGMIVSNKINIGGDMVGLTVENAVQAVNDVLEYINKPKRKPLSDNSLPLTKEELEEFSGIIGVDVKAISFKGGLLWINKGTDRLSEEYIVGIKAILWLAERFDLTGV